MVVYYPGVVKMSAVKLEPEESGNEKKLQRILVIGYKDLEMRVELEGKCSIPFEVVLVQ